MPLQPAGCRSAESALLGSGDARKTIAPATAGAVSDFDKHNRTAILEYEIKLTALLTEILLQRNQSLLGDQFERPGFGPVSRFGAGPAICSGQSSAPVVPARTADPWILPAVMVPQASSLAIRPSASSLSSPVLPSNTSSLSRLKRSVSR